jgi:hypothetical protein
MDEQQGSPEPGAGRDAGEPGDPAEGVLTLVCFTCGQEYYFDRTPPPPDISCEKCGNSVFRDFFSPAEGDEAARDFIDSTARDLDPDDAEGDVLPGDVMDLDRP